MAKNCPVPQIWPVPQSGGRRRPPAQGHPTLDLVQGMVVWGKLGTLCVFILITISLCLCGLPLGTASSVVLKITRMPIPDVHSPCQWLREADRFLQTQTTVEIA